MTHRTLPTAHLETATLDAVFDTLVATGQGHLIEDRSYLDDPDATPARFNEALDAGVLRTLRRAA